MVVLTFSRCVCRESWHRGSNSPTLLQRLRWDNIQKLGYASIRHWGYTNWWVARPRIFAASTQHSNEPWQTHAMETSL